MRRPETGLKTIIAMAVSLVVVCFGSLLIGVMLENPEANVSLPMPIVVLAVTFCSVFLAYIAATDSVLRVMYNEFLRTEKLRKNAAADESGRTQITSMGE